MSAGGAYGLLSGLLLYPDDAWWTALPDARARTGELPRRGSRRSIEAFLEDVAGRHPASLESEYVATFDFDREATLHLTFHRYGDRRERGAELARLVARYAEAGLAIDGGELPDYLPVVLEFADLVEPERAAAVLNELREPIELVRERLRDRGSLYTPLLDAVVAELPSLTRAQRRAIRELAEAEPPTELVGLPAYGDEVTTAPIPDGCGQR